MTEDKNLGKSYLKRERTFVAIFLFLMCLVLAHFVHDNWFASGAEVVRNPPAAGMPVYFLFKSTQRPIYAPEAYRVAIPGLGEWVMRTFHIKEPAIVAAGLDFCFGFVATYLFYWSTVNDLTKAKTKERTVVVGLFLAFLYFPMVWVVPWQRPETLPTALFVAVVLVCLLRSENGGIWSALLLAATACQAFVRSDVPFVFGAALVLISSFGSRLEEFRNYALNLVKGACIMLIAGGVQVYLQFVRYPHLHYWPGSDVIQLRNNFGVHNFSNGMLALSPFLVLAAFLIVKQVDLRAVDRLVLMSSVLYFLLWITVGVISEVRLFVPFLMALSIVAARTSASFLMGDDESKVAKIYTNV